MPHLLQNKTLKIVVDLPLENYRLARFDWTGKIVSVKFGGTEVSGQEKAGDKNHVQLGKGFYNEFGIDRPVGFEATEIGGWFHKIGVGLLKKEDGQAYAFDKAYKIKPAALQNPQRSATNNNPLYAAFGQRLCLCLAQKYTLVGKWISASDTARKYGRKNNCHRRIQP